MRELFKTIVKLMRETISEWRKDGASRIAAALAYYAIFSLSPLMIIIALTIGLILGNDASSDDFLGSVDTAIGEEGGQTLRQLLDNSQQATSDSIIGSLIWFAVVIWGATGLFAQLQHALNKIWEVEAAPWRSPLVFIEKRLLALLVVIVSSLLVLLSLVVNTTLSWLLTNFEEAVEINYILRPLQLGLSMLLLTTLFATIFKFLPDAIIRWRDVFVGAVFTALLFLMGQFAVGLYLAEANFDTVFGAAGSLTVLLVWIYYSAQILLFGAEFTEVWARYRGYHIRPDKDAVWENVTEAREEVEDMGHDFVDDTAKKEREQRRREREREKAKAAKATD